MFTRHKVAARLAGGERRFETEAGGVESVLAGLTGREISTLEADYGVTLDEEAFT